MAVTSTGPMASRGDGDKVVAEVDHDVCHAGCEEQRRKEDEEDNVWRQRHARQMWKERDQQPGDDEDDGVRDGEAARQASDAAMAMKSTSRMICREWMSVVGEMGTGV